MLKSPVTRVIADIILLFVVLQGWWFVAIPLALFGAWFFPFYIELIVAGLAYDSLFGFIPEEGVSGYFGTLLSIVMVGGIVASKKVVR